jgi:hypothetical protein
LHLFLNDPISFRGSLFTNSGNFIRETTGRLAKILGMMCIGLHLVKDSYGTFSVGLAFWPKVDKFDTHLKRNTTYGNRDHFKTNSLELQLIIILWTNLIILNLLASFRKLPCLVDIAKPGIINI